ncbi:hypothetical protein MSAN_00547900 [Mycena sanguinolenta]|uniref:Protein kinase domain-containing protein n=1 Tax=Mycena sanguinolenta TaxID=230812 RepID=A0A8H6Z6C0_9AGAR|nr:hypothetical protein MSAN_00547900 [Mycena sanguinolenta]
MARMSSPEPSSDIGEAFLERNKTLLQLLENLEQRHPTVVVLCSTFKAVLALELDRRSNDSNVLALLLKVQGTMTVLVQLLTLVDPAQLAEGDYNPILVDPLFGAIANMTDDIRDCGRLCDRYYSQTSIRKFINNDKFHTKFKEIGHQLEERRRNLEMVLLLAASTRLATNPAPPPPNTRSSLDDVPSSNRPRSASVESFLDEQEQSVATRDPGIDLVNVFLQSQEQRTALLAQGSSVSELRDVLRSCEQHMCTSLLAVLDSRDAKRAVLLLEGTRAQAFLDAAQAVLDRGSLPSAGDTSRARRLIIRLSEARDQLPASLFISGVTNWDEHPTFSGGFGDIYRASYNGTTVALKRIRVFQAGAGSPRSRLQFCREALVWQTLRHEYVLPLIGIDRETFSSFCMVSPWMQHGTIVKYLSEHGRSDADKMLLQIAEGLAYLHSMKIVHGDLRGSNILVSDDWNACLADFGLASVIEDPASTTSGAGALITSTANHAGSLRWFAPELIAPTFFGCDRFVRTTASDVYAFACVCVELYTGSPPFFDVSPDVAAMLKVVAGERPSRPESMSDHLWDLVTTAWAQHLRERTSMEKIIESMRAPAEGSVTDHD